MQIYAEAEQMSLFDQDGCVGKMCPEPLAQEFPREKTSVSSSRKLLELKAIPYLYIDLTPRHGNLLGLPYWELRSPWLGGSLMLNTGPAPLSAEDVYTLSQILEDSPHRKYHLSSKACLGILRRAYDRGKELPPQLELALIAQAGLMPMGFLAGAVPPVRSGQDGQRYYRALTAAFSAGAGKTAGGIGYSEQIAPTLKGSAGGNSMPSVLCLNDHVDCSEDVADNQPLVYENHGIDCRYKGPLPVAPTLSARAGTGGNNLPIALQHQEVICISGNAIDRQPHNGGNGLGCQEDIAYTLTATDHHAVFSRQRVDVFKDDDVASTESARQHKDATDLVCQPMYLEPVEMPLLIRRLSPLECERLQGFPDGWTNLPDAADSARYRALGNSVAIPCVEYIMHRIVMAVADTDISAVKNIIF